MLYNQKILKKSIYFMKDIITEITGSGFVAAEVFSCRQMIHIQYLIDQIHAANYIEKSIT